MDTTTPLNQLPPPPPPPGAPTSQTDQQPPWRAEPPEPKRPRTPKFSGSQVLAGIGTFLLTTAAITLVGARWDRFDPGERLTILLVSSVVAYGLTVFLRKIAPFTSRSLDVLVAALLPVDVAAMAVVGGASWPVVLLTAGPAAILSSEILRRRDPMIFTEVGTVVGGVLTACGLAAELTMPSFDVPLAPLVAILGLAATVASPFGRTRLVGPAWAALAGFAPAIRLLETVSFTGQGTLSDLGVLHNVTDAAPIYTVVAGVIATVALALAAVRRNSIPFGLAAFGVAATTGVDLWVRFDPPASATLIALAASLVAIELALSNRLALVRADIEDSIGNVVAAANGVLTLLAVSAAFGPYLPDGNAATADWKYTAAICGVAWLLGDLRRGFKNGQSAVPMALVGGSWAPALPGLAATIVASVQLTFGDPTLTGLVAIVMSLGAISTLRPGRLLTSWTLALIAPVLASGDWQVAAPIAVASAALMLLTGRYASSAGEHEVGFQASVLAFVPAVVGALIISDANSFTLGASFFAATLWVTAWIAHGRYDGLAFALRVLGTTAVGVMVADLADSAALAAAVLAGASIVEAIRLADDRYRILAGAMGVLAIGLGLPFDPTSAPVLGLALMTGLMGVGLVAHGRHRSNAALTTLGGVVTTLGWMFGLLSAGVASPEPYVYPILFFVSWLFHDTDESPWMVVGPSLAAATALGFWQRIETGDSGHLIVLGVLAIGSAVWGAMRRHPAALALGSAITVAVGAYEGLDSTVGIESWGWLVIAGSAALTVAAILESGAVTEDPVPQTE